MCNSDSTQPQDIITRFENENWSLEDYYERGFLPRSTDLYEQGRQAYGVGLFSEAIDIFGVADSKYEAMAEIYEGQFNIAQIHSPIQQRRYLQQSY